MTTREYSKKERAELRRLASDVYEWELGQELQALDESFREWRNGKLLSSELSKEIHEFHQHAARQLWSMYQSLREEDIVARGLAMKAISDAALSPGLRDKITRLVRHFEGAR